MAGLVATISVFRQAVADTDGRDKRGRDGT
jgi:hypothetical protein